MTELLERSVFPGLAPPIEHAVLRDVSWTTYEALLLDHLDARWPRFVYDEGTLEIMTPSYRHDRVAAKVQQFIDAIVEEWGLVLDNVGHATMRRKDLQKGFEADASIYIRNARKVCHKDEIDLNTDPPPDLVIEIEVSRSALNKLEIYSRVGIPEVWRCDGRSAVFHIRRGTGYLESSTSIALPGVTCQMLLEFLNQKPDSELRESLRAIRGWARSHLPAPE